MRRSILCGVLIAGLITGCSIKVEKAPSQRAAAVNDAGSHDGDTLEATPPSNKAEDPPPTVTNTPEDPPTINDTPMPEPTPPAATDKPMPETTKPAASDTSATPLIPRARFFGNPEKARARLSSDGKRLAYLAPVDGVLNVWVGPVDDVEHAKPVTNDTHRGIRSFSWAYTNKHTALHAGQERR